MATTEATIVTATYYLSVYGGYFNVLIGLIGNLMNIIVFNRLRLFRENQSAFYLTLTSIADFFQLIFPIATDVTAMAFSFDPAATSIIWCKLRSYFAKLTRMIATMIICLLAIDQYLSTSSRTSLRQFSTLKLAQYFVCILIIFSSVYCSVFLLFYEIRSNLGCAAFNPIFNYFYSLIHYCIFLGILPIFVSLLFSLLAYRNVRRIVRVQVPIIRRRLDHQLTAMTLLRVALFVITSLPYISLRIYQINNPISGNHSYYATVFVLIYVVLVTINEFNCSVLKLLLL